MTEPTEQPEPTEPECAFCDIARTMPDWAIPVTDEVVCFKPFGTLDPQHKMFVPVRHVTGARDDPDLTGRVFAEAARWAAKRDLPCNLVVNDGADAGQSVFHLHVHYIPRAPGDGRGYRWRR